MRASPFLLAVFSAVTMFAQGITIASNPSHIYALKIPPIPGAPFTAIEILTRTVPLDNGVMLVRRAEMLVARDGRGRTYQEARRLTDSSGGNPPVENVVVTDPVAYVRTTFELRTRALHERKLLIPAPQCADESVYETASSLGTMSVAGLLAHGMSFETGHDVTNEAWFNEDLRINLRMKMTDRRNGTILMQVKRIERREPDPALFLPPAGFVLESETQSINAH